VALTNLFLISVAAFQQPAAPPAAPAPPALVWDQRRPLRVPLSCRAAHLEAAAIHCSSDEPCRLFLELAAVEALGPKILVLGNIHTSSATLSSLALLSEDAGASWREPLARIPAAGFESALLLNDQQGWIGVQPLAQFPHDPYLLATVNGGQSWDAQHLWSEEGRHALLQQFHFDSPQRGFALIDRSSAGFELYETLTGGTTWMLRQTNPKPIATKWLRRTSEWRLREDAKLQTYELERRVGDAWRRMANFRTDLGVCKDPENP